MQLINPSSFFAWRVWRLFSISLFLVCFLLSAIIPPFQSPDEFDHVKRAYLLAKGQIILDSPKGELSGGMIDSGLAAYMHFYEKFPSQPDIKLSFDVNEEASNIHWTGIKEFSPAPGTGYYFPVIYAPQATGLIIGEILGFSVDKSYRLARFSVLVIASLIIFIAFRIYSPSSLVAALLIIPMSIFQLSSASLDGISTAVAIFAISIFMRISVDRKSSRPWLLYALTVSVIVAVSSRVHFLPLILLVFFSFLYTRSKESLVAGCVALALILAWLVIAAVSTVSPRLGTGFSTSEILFHYLGSPSSFVDILFRTLTKDNYATYYMHSFFGNLGWLDTSFPNNIYTYLYVLVFLILIFSISLKNIKSQWPASALLIFCAFSSLMLIFLALLITWNAHPASVIDGVQGRYFLVPAILIAYALNGNPGIKTYPAVISYILLGALFLFSIFNTTTLLLNRYYISDKQPQIINFKILASAPLTKNAPVEVFINQKQKDNPSALKSISIMFGTYMRKNPGSAELRLTTKDGDNLRIPFDLPDLADNHYQLFKLDNRPYIAGQIVSLTGEGIGVWESHEENGLVSSCLIYEFTNGAKRYTKGCPRP